MVNCLKLESKKIIIMNVVVKTKKAERLIMEQCIEWEDDYMNEEV